MADFGKYDKNRKGIDFEQFCSKLSKLNEEDSEKKNKSILWNIFEKFDTDNSGSIEQMNSKGENEAESVFNKLRSYAGEDGILQDSEITKMLNSEPEIQASEDNKTLFETLKTFFNNFTTTEGEFEKIVTDGIEIYKKDGKIVKKKNGDEIREYTYHNTEDGNEYVTITTPYAIINVSRVGEDGIYLDSNFLSALTLNSDGKKVIIYKNDEGKIVETIKESENEGITTLYQTGSIYMYQNFKDLPQMKLAQSLIKDGKEYYVEYDENGNTVTHTKNGDSVLRLTNKFDFENVEEFYALNPVAKDKILQVGQNIVVPNMLDVTDERIIAQGDIYEELNKYSIEQFRTKYLQNIPKETFNALNKVKGFELNNENVMMYFKFNALDCGVQILVLDDIITLSRQGKTPDEIKEYYLYDENAPQEEVAEGVTRRINLFDGFTINLRAFDGKSLNGDMSIKGFVEKELGLDITKGEGKELYDALCNISDDYTASDVVEMFSNIKYRTTKEYNDYYNTEYQRLERFKHQEETFRGSNGKCSIITQAKFDNISKNTPLTNEEAQKMYRAVIKKLTAPEGNFVNTKYDSFIEEHKNSYLKDFAMSMYCIMNKQGADLLLTGNGKYNWASAILTKLPTLGGQGFSKHSCGTLIENINADNTEFYTILNALLKSSGIDEKQMEQCAKIVYSESSTEEEKQAILQKTFPGVIENAQDFADIFAFTGEAVNVGAMIYGTGLIGNGVGTVTSFVTNGTLLSRAGTVIKGTSTISKVVNVLKGMGTSSLTFGTWNALEYTANYYTLGMENDYSDGLKSSVEHGFAFGAFAGAWGQLATSNLIKAVFKNPGNTEVAQKAMNEVNHTLGKTSSFTSSQLLSTYQTAQAKAMQTSGKEALSFVSETVGFSLYEIGSGFYYGNMVYEDGTFYNVVPNQDGTEDKIETTVGGILCSQVKNLLSFKAMGKILFMHKNGQIPNSMMNLGKAKELKIENKDGVFEVKYPDGKVVTAKSMQEVVGLSNAHYENVTLYEPLKKVLAHNGKLDLGDGVVIKNGNNGYIIELPDGKKVENKDLKVAMHEAQGEYQIYSWDNRLKAKGKIELPNKQIIILENNSYKTTTESGKELEAGSLKDLLQLFQRTLLAENVEKAFEKQDSVLIGNMVIQKSDDGSYKAMAVSAKGEVTIIEGLSVEEIFNKIDETAKQQTVVNGDVTANNGAYQSPNRQAILIKDYKDNIEENIIAVNSQATFTSYRYKDSEPIQSFTKIMTAKIKEDCIATKPHIGDCWLRGTLDKPLATSGVGNCAVAVLYNSKTNTHALYHAGPVKRNAVEFFTKDIQTVIPEGFDKVIIIPGVDPETATTSSNLFKAIKGLNPLATLQFKHSEADNMQEFISYNGDVYSLPLRGTSNFRICDDLWNYGYVSKSTESVSKQAEVPEQEDIPVETPVKTAQEPQTINFEQVFNKLRAGHVNYTLFTTADGKHLIKIENTKKLFSSQRFDYYAFDKDGKLLNLQTQVSEKVGKERFAEFKDSQQKNIHNRGGNLNAGIPVMDIADAATAGKTAEQLRSEVENTDNKADLIKRYNELADKNDIQILDNIEMSEFLDLTLKLQDLGYLWDANGRLDFNYNSASENLPNLKMTKSELHNKLLAMGISDSTIEDIEYNSNRINLELFSAIDDPEIIEEHGVSLWVVREEDAENISAKIEIATLLKNNKTIPAKERGLLIAQARSNNTAELSQKISTITENLNYLKSCNLSEEQVKTYASIMCEDRMEFSKELFDVIKDDANLVNMDLLCFNISKEDVVSKINLYKLVKNSNIQPDDMLCMLRKCTKDNVSKMELVAGMRNGQAESTVRALNEHVDDFSTEQLETIKQNPNILSYYNVADLSEISVEDLAAKTKLLSLESSEDKADFIYRVTKDNFEKIEKQLELLNYIAKSDYEKGKGNKDLVLQHVREILLNPDTEATLPLLDAIKDEKILLTRDALSHKYGSNYSKCRTLEEAEQKAELYQMVKHLQNIDLKGGILHRIYYENIDQLKQRIEEELPLLTKLDNAMSLKEPIFSEQEKVERRQIIYGIKQKILRTKCYDKSARQELIALIEDAKSMEELTSKCACLENKLRNEDEIDDILVRDISRIMTKEQADLEINFSITCSVFNFTLLYKEFPKFGFKSKEEIPIGFCNILNELKTAEEFERFRNIYKDREVINLCGASRQIIANTAKYNLYKEFTQNPQVQKLDEYSYQEIITGIGSGVLTNTADITDALNESDLIRVRESLANYRNGKLVPARKIILLENLSTVAKDPNFFFATVKASFKNVDIEKLQQKFDAKNNNSINGLEVLGWLCQNNYSKTFEEIGSDINNADLQELSKRNSILTICSDEVAYSLAFCSCSEFERVVTILEKRPQILFHKYDKQTFDKLINLSDAEFEALKIPLKERVNQNIDKAEYSRYLEERINSDFNLDLSTWHAIERERLAQLQNVIGKPVGTVISFDESKPLTKQYKPVTESPTAKQLMQELEQTGHFSVSIADEGGMNPAQTDPAIIHKNEVLDVYKSTKTSVDIGETRIWDKERLARDLLQNFYDGNGYTLEGVSIDVVQKENGKYAVTISGKGIFDYQRVLDFGAHSTNENAQAGNGANPNDSRRAGKYGEGSKVLTGNLLCNYGSDYIRYRCGDWVLDLRISEVNELGKRVIERKVSKADERLDGNTYEFETDDIELINSLAKAKDYFYSPTNEDFANFDFENEYFGIKLLPEGQKGNLYIVQRYEVEGQKGFDGTLDGISIVFKRQPDDVTITRANYFIKFDTTQLGTGRNRVGLDNQKLEKLIRRYAMTLDDEQLIQIIGSMKKEFLYNSESPNIPILKGFISAAAEKHLKIDFGHNDYVAVSKCESEDNIKLYITGQGKIPVIQEMSKLGIPSSRQYSIACAGQLQPEIQLTTKEKKKLTIINEAVKMFSSYLDLKNYDIITEGECAKPVYVVEDFPENKNPKAKSKTAGQAITDKFDESYQGQWMQREFLNTMSFFEILATSLHEHSHKVGGDGSDAFNQRLIKLQQLIVDISDTNPDFCQKLNVLYQKFNEVDGKKLPTQTVPPTDFEAKIVAEINRKIAQRLTNQVSIHEENTRKEELIKFVEEHPDEFPEDIEDIKILYGQDVASQVSKVDDDIKRNEYYWQRDLKCEFQYEHSLRNKIRKFFGKEIPPKPGCSSNEWKYWVETAKADRLKILKDAEDERRGKMPSKDVNKNLPMYQSPQHSATELLRQVAPTPVENMFVLQQNGSVVIDIPKSSDTKPKISNSSILKTDRSSLGVAENIPLLVDYNSAQEWSTDVVARDLMQNFYDGHGGTLDGIKIEIKVVGKDENGIDKYKIKISGDSEYNYFYLDTIGASGDKTHDIKAAGGFGEGAKMACKTLLGANITNKITFASGDWNFAFELEKDVKRVNQHVTRVLNENKERVNGTYVEFETSDIDMINSVLKSKDYFKHSENTDFSEPTMETDRFSFRVLNEKEKGNLYYIQRYAIKNKGQLEGALNGIQIIFKEQLTDSEKAEIGLQDDCDRQGFSTNEMRDISKIMARSMTDKQLLEAIQDLERFWKVKDVKKINERDSSTPEQQFALGVIDAAIAKGLKFNTEETKFVAANDFSNDIEKLELLKKHGYTIVESSLCKIGFPTVDEVLKNINQVKATDTADVEERKLAILNECMPNVELKIYESTGTKDKVAHVRDKNGKILYIAIDKSYLMNVDFNTLYTQVCAQNSFSSGQASWGYNMTESIAKQLELSTNLEYIEKFKICEKLFNELK